MKRLSSVLFSPLLICQIIAPALGILLVKGRV
jgi:hypothetical protein